MGKGCVKIGRQRGAISFFEGVIRRDSESQPQFFKKLERVASLHASQAHYNGRSLASCEEAEMLVLYTVTPVHSKRCCWAWGQGIGSIESQCSVCTYIGVEKGIPHAAAAHPGCLGQEAVIRRAQHRGHSQPIGPPGGGSPECMHETGRTWQ